MWRNHSNINPLPHATVVDVTEVRPPIVLMGIGSMLLHMDSAAQHFFKNAGQLISELVMPPDNMPTQSTQQGMSAKRIQRGPANRVGVMMGANGIAVIDLHAHTEPDGGNNFLV